MRLLLALAALVVGQGQIFYQDLDGTTRISNVKDGEGSGTGGVFSFDVTGSPLVIVEKLELGLKLTAPKIDGKLTNAGRTTTIKELHTHGDTVAILDTKVAENASIDLAKRRGTPPPKPAEEQSVTEFHTERLDYTGTETAGTFTIPAAFTIHSQAAGITHTKTQNETVDKRFSQTVDVKGVSGSFNLNPAARQMPLLSGTIEGPITFDLVRSETTLSTNKVEVGKLSGTADRVTIDMEKSHTVTLAGHVKVRGEIPAFIGTSEGDTVILTFDEGLNLVQVKILGDPTKSTAREKKGGGVNS